MANQIDFSPMLQGTPETGVSRGMSHLSSVLDAMMARDAQAKQHKEQLEQAARLAAEDDKRQRDALNWQMKHQGAEEDIAREKNAADEADNTAKRAQASMDPFQKALNAGDIPTAQMVGAPGGLSLTPQAPTPAMDMLDALAPQSAPADPLGAPHAPPQAMGGGEEAAMGGRPSGGQSPAAVSPPPMTPLDAQMPPPVDLAEQAPPQPPLAPLSLPAKPTKYNVTVPGGSPVEYDPEAAQARSKARGAQVAGDIGGLSSPSKFHEQALKETQALARTGRYKTDDEVVKAYEERRKDLEHEANAAERARIVSASRGLGQDKVHPPGELDFLDPDTNKVIGQARSPEEGHKFREGHDALVGMSAEIDRLKAHVLEHGRTDIGGIPIKGGEVAGQRDALISNVTDYLTTLKNTGVLNGTEYERYKALLGTSLLRGGKAAAAVLEQIRSGARTHYLSHSGSARARGATDGGRTAPANATPAAKADAAGLADELLGGM